MHFHCEVHIPESSKDDPVNLTVEELMAPYCEHDGPHGFWDWFQIGGRWKGQHMAFYNPDKDPANHDDSGKLMWPTFWKHHEGDVMPVANVSDELTSYTLVAAGTVFHTEEWSPTASNFVPTGFDGNVKAKLKELGITDGALVTVDYHS